MIKTDSFAHASATKLAVLTDPAIVACANDDLTGCGACVHPDAPGSSVKVALKPNRLRVAVLCGLSLLSLIATANVSAQNAPEKKESGDKKTTLQAIVVTGTRGPQRTVTTSTAPIDVITGTELQRVGKPDVLSALNALVPSFNSPTRLGGGTGQIIATGTLRGLNPDQMLVLVDGKRRHKTALINAVSQIYPGSVPTDLSLIPVSSVDHIEVLRDGAAAKYGSDAISGVINIILKRGGSNYAAFTGGQNMDRSDGTFYQADLALGRKVGSQGFFDFFVGGRKQEASNRAEPVAPNVRMYPLVNGQLDPREATIDRLITRNFGAFPQKTLNLGYNAGWKLGTVDLYSFATFSRRTSILNYTFRTPTNVNTLPELYPNGFRPHDAISEHDYQVVFGAKGRLGEWDWDASTSYGQDRAAQDESQTLNASLGPGSPTSFYVGTLLSNEWINSFDVTRGFPVGENLQVSAGVQHRLEKYRIYAGDPAGYAVGTYVIPPGQPFSGQRPAPGVQGAATFTPADAGALSRNNLAAYAEVTYDPTSRLTLDVAGRAEHFDDSSGDTLIGEASGRYQLAPWVTLRAAVSTGFRAPSLAQEIYATSTSQFRTLNGVVELLQIKTLPVGSPGAQALGAVPLKPETSRNFSAGVAIQPMDNLVITVDAYEIDVDKRIALTGTLTGPVISAILQATGLPPNTSAQYFTNAIDTKTKGVDVVGAYKVDLGALGSMQLNAGFNYNSTKITSVIPNPPELSVLGPQYVLFNRAARGALTYGLPKTKIVIGDTWSIGKFSLSPRVTRFGGYTSPAVSASDERYNSARWIVDVESSYQFAPSLTLTVGATNLFDIYPTRQLTAAFNAQQGRSPYSSAAPFGFTGGAYYVRISGKF